MTGEWCDCDGCRELRAIYSALCPELPEPVRRAKRQNDRLAQRRWEEQRADQPLPLWAA